MLDTRNSALKRYFQDLDFISLDFRHRVVKLKKIKILKVIKILIFSDSGSTYLQVFAEKSGCLADDRFLL